MIIHPTALLICSASQPQISERCTKRGCSVTVPKLQMERLRYREGTGPAYGHGVCSRAGNRAQIS